MCGNVHNVCIVRTVCYVHRVHDVHSVRGGFAVCLAGAVPSVCFCLKCEMIVLFESVVFVMSCLCAFLFLRIGRSHQKTI